MLTDWFARKNLMGLKDLMDLKNLIASDIYNVYYYWHDSGSYNYCLHNSIFLLSACNGKFG